MKTDQPKPRKRDAATPTAGEATDKSYAANKIRSMHEQMQQALMDARNTPEYAEEKASEPTTGEWTVENLTRITDSMGISSVSEFHQRICDAHNAALATVLLASQTAVNTLWEQLASERASSFERGRIKQGLVMGTEIQQLRDQLDKSGREWLELCKDKSTLESCTQQLREQLSTAVEALKVIEIGHGVDARTARAALAKAGKQ